MVDSRTEIDNTVAVLWFALSILWAEEFQKRDSPTEAAKAYANEMQELLTRAPSLSGYPQSHVADLQKKLAMFFDQVASEVLSRTQRLNS